jgi:SAM-dependent methyltransferase
MKAEPSDAEVLPASTTYWLTKNGDQYSQQQIQRCKHDNKSYELQTDWLSAHLLKLASKTPERTLRVLDFGCGYGRFAQSIGGLDGIDYFGFDISESMVRPLFETPPRPLLGIIHERVRVDSSLKEAFPEGSFDVIFTVSVMIHNPPEAVRRMLKDMSERLAEDGRIILIENPFSPVTLLENMWHAGCWLHNFAEYVDGVMDMTIVDRFAGGRHALYVLSHSAQRGRSVYSFQRDFDSPAVAYSLEDLRRLEMERALFSAAALSREVLTHMSNGMQLGGQLNDLRELLSYSVEREAALRAEVEDLSRRLDQARKNVSERSETARAISAAIAASRSIRTETQPALPVLLGAQTEPLLHWNSAADTRYAHSIAGFEKVLHIFHQEWFGIRAATGSLPGMKLAIPAERPLAGAHYKELIETLRSEQPLRIVFHAMSDNMAALIRLLAHAGLQDRLYLVLHGAPAQWTAPHERHIIFTAFDIARSGLIRKIHVLKAGFDLPLGCLFRPMLFNLSPNISTHSPVIHRNKRSNRVAFLPGWALFRKNIWTNALGAALSDRIDELWAYAQELVLPPSAPSKLKIVPFHNRDQTFQLMALSSITLNVTLVDCHPMVNVESQALGTPCLRGPLFLDALEDHPYMSLTAVTDPTSVREIRESIDRLLEIEETERAELIRDYQKQSDLMSVERYKEFLEL